MPELPDVVVYIEALGSRIVGHTLQGIRIAHPFLLRTVHPPVEAAVGKKVTKLRRLGKRIAIGLEKELWLVLHLMIAGRLHWRDREVKSNRRVDLAAFDFDDGSLLLTEAGTQKRASLHVVEGEDDLAAFNPGGLEVLDATAEEFTRRLTQSNHTLKRALTNPRLFSGIGNAYSDEILHQARLSPVTLTQKLSTEQIQRLYEATVFVLIHWTDKLRVEAAGGFPEKVTAFLKDMAVHGRYGLPCPVCSSPVQRIRYASNETNYCATCQTGGKLLADRALSRLLKKDWPKTLEEWEAAGG
jgi:formamidopyrimidine-DNA glycosylase